MPAIPERTSDVLLAEKNGDKQTVAGQCKKALGDYHLSGITPQSLQASLNQIDAEVYAPTVEKEEEPLLAEVFTIKEAWSRRCRNKDMLHCVLFPSKWVMI